MRSPPKPPYLRLQRAANCRAARRCPTCGRRLLLIQSRCGENHPSFFRCECVQNRPSPAQVGVRDIVAHDVVAVGQPLRRRAGLRVHARTRANKTPPGVRSSALPAQQSTAITRQDKKQKRACAHTHAYTRAHTRARHTRTRTFTHTRTRTHSPTPTPTHTRAHAHAHAHAHAPVTHGAAGRRASTHISCDPASGTTHELLTSVQLSRLCDCAMWIWPAPEMR